MICNAPYLDCTTYLEDSLDDLPFNTLKKAKKAGTCSSFIYQTKVRLLIGLQIHVQQRSYSLLQAFKIDNLEKSVE